ncbi:MULTISPECIES: hypothetical protein [unclassified Brachybacterium]|uniref:hypothetical protein n=1 Tax=unclassified Brachybacterium TaxID=2623841 RepID=UPI000C804928|nr:hypothetical protein [Brachybacterium sp. UMB0905]PMC75491.1 hypothetical protein CJ197_07000 [Brachybacterium sp. UMB0905]
MRPSRRLVLSAAAVGLALAASGCSVMSPTQTHEFYQAGDGMNATIEVDGAMHSGIRNAAVFIGEDGSAHLTGTAVNYSEEPVTLELTGMTAEGTTVFSTSVSLEPQGVQEFGAGQGQQLVEANVGDVVPGAVLQLEVAAEGQSETSSLPTITGDVTYYQDAEGSAASDGGA